MRINFLKSCQNGYDGISCYIPFKKRFYIFGYWCNHDEYQQFVIRMLKSCDSPDSIITYKSAVPKLFIFNLNNLIDIITPFYFSMGKPTLNQPEIFHSFIFTANIQFLFIDVVIVCMRKIYKYSYNNIHRSCSLCFKQ